MAPAVERLCAWVNVALAPSKHCLACVAGAKQVTLEGVYHSPLGAAVGRSWYGSPDVIDRWVHEIWRDADELAGGQLSISISTPGTPAVARGLTVPVPDVMDRCVHKIWRNTDELTGGNRSVT